MIELGVPEVSPERVAIHSLKECYGHLSQTRQDNLFIISAACSAHRAIQSALTAALAGSENIGASPPKLRKAWLEYNRAEPDNRPRSTPGFRVMGLRELVELASTSPLPWSGSPLPISSCQAFYLLRLASYRDDFEHPKQLTYVLTNREVAWSIAFTAPLVLILLSEVRHQLYGSMEMIEGLISDIQLACEEIEQIELKSR